MLDYMKAITNHDDALQKTNKTAVMKVITAVLIFLIPTFVRLIVNIAAPNTDYQNCLTIRSSSQINSMYITNAEKYVSDAERTLNNNDYNKALIYINNIKDESKRSEFSQRLKTVKEKIDNKNQSSSDQGTDITNANIIYLGDSRTSAYINLKSYLGIDDSKETIYAKVSTGYDDYFKSHMNSASNLINSNKDKTYNITVNYGVNANKSYKGFCDSYDTFIQNMDKKHSFYIVSVNPIDEANVRYYKQSNTNANVETFNNYMKTTCINQINSHSPNAKVYYCDTYGSKPVSEWISNKYISIDGIHYTKTGYKYIYDYIKKCIASH